MAFGSTLGEVLVKVGIDTKSLDKGLATTKAKSEQAGNSFQKLGAYGALAWAAVGTAALKFGVDAVKAFEESQNVAAQTTAVLTSTGNAVGYTTDQIHEMAAGLQSLTTYSDESVQSAENLLLTFTQIGHDVFPQATRAVLDMSTAMGTDLKSSSILVGKALNDPIKGMTALRRVGVAFDDTQLRMIKHLTETGHVMKAQKVILAELGKEFGGSAAAAAHTFAGRIEQLKNQFNDFQEAIGGTLVVVLEQLITDLQGVGTEVGNLLELIPGLGSAAGDASDHLSVFAKASAVVAFGIHAALHPLDTLLHGFSIDIPDGTTAADRALEQHAKQIGLTAEEYKAMRDAQQKLKEETKKWAEDTMKAFDVVDLSADAVKNTFTLTAAAAVKAVAAMATAQNRIATDLRKLDQLPIGDNLKKKLIDLGPAMVDAFVRGTPAQRTAIRNSLKTFDDAVRDTNARVKALAHSGGSDTGKAFADGLLSGIAAKTPAIAAAAAAAVQAAIDAAKRQAGVASPSTVMRELGWNLVDGLTEGIQQHQKQLENALQKMVDDASARVQKLVDRMNTFKDKISGGIGGFAQNLISGIGGLFGQTDESGNAVAVGGGDISAFIAAQVAQAKALADVLKKLSNQGLSQGLLAQIAGQGAQGVTTGTALLQSPELIAQLNAAQGTIQHFAGGTADMLGQQFFGDSISKARDRLHELADALREFKKQLAFEEKHGITVNVTVQGDVVSDDDLMRKIRKAVQLASARNGFQTGFG